MKFQLFIFTSLIFLNSAAALDLSRAPEPSENVTDLRPVPYQCYNPNNCVAGNVSECSYGLRYFNTGMCNSPYGSCIITRVQCGDHQTREKCFDSTQTNLKECMIQMFETCLATPRQYLTRELATNIDLECFSVLSDGCDDNFNTSHSDCSNL